jgi:hypothetical protein
MSRIPSCDLASLDQRDLLVGQRIEFIDQGLDLALVEAPVRADGRLPGLARRGDHAQLLQHAELVKEAPRLNDLSILNSVYAHPDDSRRLAGRWEAGKLAVMRSVGGPSRHDHIPFSDLFVNRKVKVGERVAIGRDEHFGAFRPGRHPRQRARAAVDLVRGDDLIEHSQIPLAKGLLEEAADDRFVGFC